MCMLATELKRETGFVDSTFIVSAICHIHCSSQEVALFKVIFLFYSISVTEKDRTTLFYVSYNVPFLF